MRSRHEKAAFAALVALAALLGFLAASRPWVSTVIPDPIAERTVQVSGRQAAPVVPAVALVALAGGLAVLTTRRLGRAVAGVLLVLAGAAAAAASVGVRRSPATAVDGAVADATGRAGAHVTTALTAWPWLGVASGVLLTLAGAVAVLRARAWGSSARRFEPVVSVGERDPEPDADPGAAWDALSRGEDPTR